MDRLRSRAAAIEEGARAVQGELAGERARLHRERLELNRLREEVRQAVDEALADARLAEHLAAVQRLREELAACGDGGPSLEARTR
jgi:hypothetical protein